jgi:hypothetical protein
MDLFSDRLPIVLFLFLVLEKLLLLIKLLAPTSVSNPVIAFLRLEDLAYNLRILFAELFRLRLAFLHELDPVVQG